MSDIIRKFNLINCDVINNSDKTGLNYYGALRLNTDYYKNRLLTKAISLCTTYIDENIDNIVESKNIIGLDKFIIDLVFANLKFESTFYEFLGTSCYSIKHIITETLLSTIAKNGKVIYLYNKYIIESNISDTLFSDQTIVKNTSFYPVYKNYLLDRFRQFDIITGGPILTDLYKLIKLYCNNYNDTDYYEIIDNYNLDNLLDIDNIKSTLVLIKNSYIAKQIKKNINNAINRYVYNIEDFINLISYLIQYNYKPTIYLEKIFNDIEFVERFHIYITTQNVSSDIVDFIPYLQSYPTYIDNNFSLIYMNRDNVLDLLTNLNFNNKLAEVTDKFNTYRENVLVLNEFRKLKVNIKSKIDIPEQYCKEILTDKYDLNIVNIKCNMSNIIITENVPNMQISSNINYYVKSFDTFYKTKFSKRTYRISLLKSVITVNHNGYNISGNIIDINIMMVICEETNSTLENITSKLITMDKNYEGVLKNINDLHKCGYISLDIKNKTFSIPDFKKSITVDTSINIIDKNLETIAECYITKLLKSSSSKLFSSDEICDHITNLNTEQFNKIDIYNAMNSLIDKEIIKYTEEMYIYNV